MAGTQTAEVGSGNAWDGFDGDMNAALDAEFGIQREAKGDTNPSANSPGAGTQQQTATTQPNAGPMDAPTHILTADGKHTIPYDVLKRERERAQQAEASNRALQAELERLRGAHAQPGGSTSAATTTATADAPEPLSDEELALLEEEDPLQAKAYRAAQYAMNEARQLRSQVTPVLQQQQQARLSEEQQMALAVQQDIEQTPALRWLQDRSGTGDEEAQALWAEAVNVDNTLKTLPAFAKLSQAERFAEVVKQMETAHGAFQLPAEYLPVQTSTQQAETAAQKAARLVEEARQKPAGHITRLSQMEGGARPESLQQRLDQMSAAEMFALSEQMSEQEFDQLRFQAGF